tara:strand:+ start:326 stop:571 length:246 start_codon:yes stop_codon:yes gene_type:complete
MKVIDYFNKIEDCSKMTDEEGFEAYDRFINNLTNADLITLIIEFTSIIVKADVSLEILENPFETDDEDSKHVNKNHLKLVH